MRIITKATNISLNDSISEYIEKKIGPLEKFITDFLPNKKDLENPIEDRKGRVEFFIDVGKESAGSNKGLFFAKAKIIIPGEKIIIATARSNDLREAINILKDELYPQLITVKERIVSITERKVRKVKRESNLDEAARFYRKGRIRDEGN
jgi:ribosomal subunit interface protein